MKRILHLLIALLFTIAGIGQTEINKAYLFGNLNASQVPTGYLAPYGTDLLDKEDFNGLNTDSNVINTMDIVRMAYADVFTARFYSGASTLPSPETFSQVVDAANEHALALFYARYSIFDENAIKNNQVRYSNGQLLDVAGRTSSPYVVQSLFAAYPKQAFYRDTVRLFFDPSLFTTNTGLSIQSLQADFGAGFQTINPNTSLSYGYNDSSGLHVIKLKMQLSDNSVSYAKLAVSVIVSSAQGNNTARYAPVRTFFGIMPPPEINVPAQPGVHSGCNGYVIRSVNTPAGQLRRPLIVVEGFDVNDGAPRLSTNYEVNDLIKEWESVQFGAPNNRFTHYLDDIAGYDLVFIDWKNSMDDITKNAVALEALIGRVNALKAQSGFGNVRNVIMGISMGGLVSRYCLASMTKRGFNPQTRLLITHDSPHQGAYVPIGMQHLVKDIQNKNYGGIRLGWLFGQLDQAANLLDKTATRQLLKLAVTDDRGTVVQNTFLSSVYRNMITFSVNDPQPSYEFIATSQGSQCGVAPLPVGSFLVSGYGDFNASGYSSLLTLGILSRMKIHGDVEVTALTGNSSHQILHCLLKREIRLFWGIVKGDNTVFNIDRNEPSFNTIPWESVPGGVVAMGDYLQGSNPIRMDWGGWFLGFNARVTLAPRFGFIPVFSVLDMASPPTNYQAILNLRAFTTSPAGIFRPGQIIAQERFFGGGSAQYNNAHTTFTARNAEWLYTRMENLAFTDCASHCVDDNSINGSSSVCTPSNYAIAELPAGAEVTWSVSPQTLASVFPTTAAQTTLNVSGNGTVELRADILFCGNIITVRKQINVSTNAPLIIAGTYTSNGNPVPIQPYLSVANNVVCWNEAPYANFELQNVTSVIYRSVYTSDPSIAWSGGHGPNFVMLNCYFTGPEQVIIFRIEATNGCGTTTYDVAFRSEDCYQEYQYLVSPNPASSELSIEAKMQGKTVAGNKATPVSNTPLFKVKLFNEKGFVIKSSENKGQKAKIYLSTEDVPNGTYFLHIIEEKRVIKRQIIIQH